MKWISVEKKIPSHLELVIATDGRKAWISRFNKDENCFVYLQCLIKNDWYLPTHWMPLPELPI